MPAQQNYFTLLKQKTSYGLIEMVAWIVHFFQTIQWTILKIPTRRQRHTSFKKRYVLVTIEVTAVLSNWHVNASVAFWIAQKMSFFFWLQLLASGRWVKLEKTTYVDPAGSTRHDDLFLSLVFVYSVTSLRICPSGSGRPWGGQLGKPTQTQTVFWGGVLKPYLLRPSGIELVLEQGVPGRCWHHCAAEEDTAQRLRGDGEAVSSPDGMLHVGVSCRW